MKRKMKTIARFIRNGVPDGFMVRLASLEEKHFGSATQVLKMPNGGIDIRNEHITVGGYHKGEFTEYWPVFKEKKRAKR
jgi:hypothetical protein